MKTREITQKAATDTTNCGWKDMDGTRKPHTSNRDTRTHRVHTVYENLPLPNIQKMNKGTGKRRKKAKKMRKP